MVAKPCEPLDALGRCLSRRRSRVQVPYSSQQQELSSQSDDEAFSGPRFHLAASSEDPRRPCHRALVPRSRRRWFLVAALVALGGLALAATVSTRTCCLQRRFGRANPGELWLCRLVRGQEPEHERWNRRRDTRR